MGVLLFASSQNFAALASDCNPRTQDFAIEFEFAPSDSGETNEIYYPTVGPTDSPAPSLPATKMPTETPFPSFPPTLISSPNESESQTSLPNIGQAPTRIPSRFPTALITEAPVTSTPTDSLASLPPIDYSAYVPTPAPTSSQSRTLAPTRRPTKFPTVLPSSDPSYQQTPRPSRMPSAAPANSSGDASSLPSETIQPSPRYLRTTVSDIPLAQFETRLAFAFSLNESQLEKSASELQTILSDYLMNELADQDLVDGIVVIGINLLAIPSGNSTRVATRRRRMRGLQDETTFQIYSYNVSGTADVNVPTNSSMENKDLARSLDGSIITAFGGPEKQPELSEYIRDHQNSSVLASTVQAGVQTQPLPPEEEEAGKSPPSIVAIVFGFILVTLALLSLLYYAVICWKGHKKRAAQQKRERQGVHATYPRPSPAKAQIPQQAQPLPGFLASTSVMRKKDDSSEDGSSYQGFDSETDSVKGSDAFARELKLAASLDKRAWEDYQRKLKSIDQEGLVLGEEPERSRVVGRDSGAHGNALDGVNMYGAHDDLDEDSNTEEGFEINQTGSAIIIGPAGAGDDDYQSTISGTTFPYGDEDTRRIDPPGPRGSSVEPKRTLDDPAGFRVSQLALSKVNNVGLERTLAQENIHESPDDDISDDSNDPITELMNSLTAKTNKISVIARESPKPVPSASPTQPISSYPLSQAVQLSSSAAENKPRGSDETKVIPPKAEKSLSSDDDNSALQQPSKDSNSFDSLKTIDIINEVQKLASFVKSYELKREKSKHKEKERGAWAAKSGSDRTSPSIGYEISGKASTLRGINSTNLGNIYDDDSLSQSSTSDWSSDGDYGPKGRRFVQKKLFERQTSPVALLDDDDSSMESDDNPQTSQQGSDDSRLGIHPFNVQQIMAAQPDVEASRRRIAARLAAQPTEQAPVLKPVSKPPVTRNAFKSTLLSPIPATPDSHENNYNESPLIRRAPLDEISKNPMRTPENRRSFRKSPIISPRESSENYRIDQREMSEVESTVGNSGTDFLGTVELTESSRHRKGKSNIPMTSFPLNSRSSWERRKEENTLRNNPRTLHEDKDVISLTAPSDEELTRDGSSRLHAAPLESNGGGRRSGNKGFNNIISMFENKPKEAIFPPNENWQYNF